LPPKKSSNEDLAAQIKKDMINYIGPIFQELKGEIKKGQEETHKLGILMDQMDRKIDTALEASLSVLEHEDTVKDHGERIDGLEKDVLVLKAVSSPKA